MILMLSAQAVADTIVSKESINTNGNDAQRVFTIVLSLRRNHPLVFSAGKEQIMQYLGKSSYIKCV